MRILKANGNGDVAMFISDFITFSFEGSLKNQQHREPALISTYHHQELMRSRFYMIQTSRELEICGSDICPPHQRPQYAPPASSILPNFEARLQASKAPLHPRYPIPTRAHLYQFSLKTTPTPTHHEDLRNPLRVHHPLATALPCSSGDRTSPSINTKALGAAR